jgi:spore maturation protein CgeB
MNRMNISFFGSSLVSAHWNEAATYYRGLIRALADRGHRVTFYEPDACERLQHRDLPDPDWARVVVYPATDESALDALEQAEESDLIIKCSGVGVFDELLEAAALELKKPETLVAFLDMDATATLNRIQKDPEDSFRVLIPEYDFILTYGGSTPVVDAYLAAGATECVPIYNALDPRAHFPAEPQARFEGDLGFLGNRMPDSEARVEEFLFKPATQMPDHKFVLGGDGWQDKPMPPNVTYLGHVHPGEHNAFNCSPRAVLDVDRGSIARCDFSPPTRVLEAAGAGACLITDKWDGVEMILEPGREVLVAGNGDEVTEHLQRLTPTRAREIGRAACSRVLAEHTYAHRADQLEKVLEGKAGRIVA